MRMPSQSDLTRLSMLTAAREKLALQEVSRAAALRDAAERRVRELKSSSAEVTVDANAVVFQKWLLWRDQKLKASQVDLARATADYLATVQRCGRFIAEAKVVEDMTAKVLKFNSDEKEKKAQDDRVRSHLLADNVGDQNI